MFLLGALAVGSAAIVTAAAISFVCDELSEREIQRQRQMQKEYNEYEQSRCSEYKQTCEYYEKVRKDKQNEYEQEIREFNSELIQRRKEENRKFYDNVITLLDDQRTEKKKLLQDCRDIISVCKGNIQTQQNTYLRFKSIKTTVISLEEAKYKLEAYLKYLDIYKQRLHDEFERCGQLLEPFSLTLPKECPYEGQVLLLEPDRFEDGRYSFGNLGQAMIDKNEKYILENSNGHECLPFMFHAHGNRCYLSYSEGMLKNSIGGTIGINVEVKEIKPKFINLSFMKNDFLHLRIDKSDLINQRRKTPVGSSLHVYVTDYDFALKNTIKTSEKVADGLNIAQFDSIIMLQTDQERNEFINYLKENDLLDYDDEWRIAPVWNDDKSNVDGIIMQVGIEYAYEAVFEEFAPDKIVLRYKKRLEKDQFVSFDDVFVATNVTVDVLSPGQVEESIDEYQELFEECKKFQLYLVSEFTTQKKMMINSPMSVYLNQWTEVTNRLIDVKSVGGHITLNVCEFERIRIMGEAYTFIYVDNNAEVIQYNEKELREKRNKFYIQFTEYEQLMCKLEINEDYVVIKVKGDISAKNLLELNFNLEMYSIANPYAEKQHVRALDSFREGRVVNEALKTAIVNIASETYHDNGHRISKLNNQNIASNEAQLTSVVRAFAEEKFFMIQGPPGTGKTTVIKELILQQLDVMPNSKILVVSQANVAVDNVLRGVIAITKETNLVDDRMIVRCGDIDKISDDLIMYSFERKYDEYRNNIIKNDSHDDVTQILKQKWIEIIDDKDNSDIVSACLLGCFQIIGATCVGLENRRYGLSGVDFDLVIIDEAGKALPGELLIPLNRAKKAIIIGDHKQLPPVIDPALYKNGKVEYDDIVDQDQQIDFLNKSFFQRLYEDCPDSMKGMLKTQFRMPPVIANLVNIFYDNQLKNGENCDKKYPIFLNSNLIFIDMKNEQDYFEIQDTYGNNQKSSPYNKKEIEAVGYIVEKIKYYYKERIVIITPYKRQKNLMIKTIRDKNVWINTIDAFQGDEENIVIFCMTRSKKPTEYFSDSARLNVAFSRAKNTLIIVGDSRYFEKYSKEHEMRSIGEYLSENAYNINYSEFVDEDFDLSFNPQYHDEIKEERSLSDISLDVNQFFSTVSTKEEKIVIANCECCNNPLKEGEKILCSNCLTKSVPVKCICCGNIVMIPAYDKYIGRRESPVVCDYCMKMQCEECGKVIFIKKVKVDDLRARNRKCLCKECNKLYSSPIIVQCEKCGKEITYSYNQKKAFEEKGLDLPRICSNCKTEEVGICIACHKPIFEKERIVKKDGYSKPLIHKECRRCIWKTEICRNCGQTFDITYGDKIYFDSKNYDYPVRCEKCRKAKNNEVKIGVCCVCGGEIYQKGDKAIKYDGWSNIHKECKNKIYILPKCKVCGDRFSITYGEKLFYERKGFELPQKCKRCR